MTVLAASPKPLHPLLRLAVLAGKEETLLLLTRRGHDVNARDARGRTPLMLAAVYGRLDTCRLLLDAGADPHIKGDDGNDALALAVAHGHDAVSSLLIERSSAPALSELARAEDAPDVGSSALDSDDPMEAWEEDLDRPVPIGNDDWMPLALAVQNHLSTHHPIDTSEDWSEVELPLFETLHLSRFTEEFLARLRSLLLDGIGNGVLAASSIEELVSPDDGDGLEVLPAHHLRLVVAELGILTEESGDAPPVEVTAGDDEVFDSEITAALSFLASLASAEHDPEFLYLREAGRLRRLSPRQEAAAAAAMRDAASECLQAIARCPRALAALAAQPAVHGTAPAGVDDDEPGTLPDSLVPRTNPPAAPHHGYAAIEPQAAVDCRNGCGPDPSVTMRGPVSPPLSELARLDDETLWPPAHADARDGFVRALGRALDARRRLVESHLWLVLWMARHYTWSGLSLLDLVQEGGLGLISAVETFDPGRGNRLSTYAGWSIRAALTNAIPRQAMTIRIPARIFLLVNQLDRATATLSDDLGRDPTESEIAERMQLPVSRVDQLVGYGQQPVPLAAVTDEESGDEPGCHLEDTITPTPEASVLAADRQRIVRRALARIKPRYRDVIRQRYGLAGSEERTLEEIGRAMDLSRERVRQIEAQALAALRRILNSMDAPRTTRRSPLALR